jgi:acyl CoA:acetate/3-ketoacid CoA transferase alpha subunit
MVYKDGDIVVSINNVKIPSLPAGKIAGVYRTHGEQLPFIAVPTSNGTMAFFGKCRLATDSEALAFRLGVRLGL